MRVIIEQWKELEVLSNNKKNKLASFSAIIMSTPREVQPHLIPIILLNG